MKRMTVEVCVCAQCVMNGAMDIIEAIEGLQELKTQLRFNSQVCVVSSSKLGEPDHTADGPYVKVNGIAVERPNSETVMSKVISELREHI